jgi:hypothetical protein
MTTILTHHDHRQRVGGADSTLMRAIGALTIASTRLETLSRGAVEDPTTVPWLRVTHDLLDDRNRILSGIGDAPKLGKTLRIRSRDHSEIVVDAAHLDRLASRMEKHLRHGQLLGISPLTAAAHARTPKPGSSNVATASTTTESTFA